MGECGRKDEEGMTDNTQSTTSTEEAVQKGLDEDASYTISEFVTYLEIIYNNKSTLQTLVSIESAIGSKIIGQKGPVRSVANAIRLREHGWVAQSGKVLIVSAPLETGVS